MMRGTGSGVCELTNQNGLGIQEVGVKKMTLSIKACKPILVVTQNKMINSQISVICPL